MTELKKARRAVVPILVAALTGGCGGGSVAEVDEVTTSTAAMVVSPTTSSPTPDSTAPPTTTTASPASTAESAAPNADPLSSLPAECVDPMKRFVVAMDPVATNYDFENAGLRDFEQLMIAMIPVVNSLVEETPASCMDETGPVEPDALPALLEYARQEAPGAVPWLEVQVEMQDLQMANTCSGFIEVVQDYVDRGGTVADLSRAERYHAFSNFGGINAWCDLRTAGEYASKPEYLAFLQLEP